MATFECFKCGGSGQVPFRHIENGVCFTCGGTGKLAYRPRAKAWTDPHPELLVPEADRATEKQWNYLAKLCGDSDTRFCEMVRKAGGVMATQRYLNKATMSRAIEIARGAA